MESTENSISDLIFGSETYLSLVIEFVSMPECYASLAPLSHFHCAYFNNAKNKTLFARLVTYDLGIWFELSPQLQSYYFKRDTHVRTIIRRFYTDINWIVNHRCSKAIQYRRKQFDSDDAYWFSFGRRHRFKVILLVELGKLKPLQLWTEQMCEKIGVSMAEMVFLSDAIEVPYYKELPIGWGSINDFYSGSFNSYCNLTAVLRTVVLCAADAQYLDAFLHWIVATLKKCSIDYDAVFAFWEELLVGQMRTAIRNGFAIEKWEIVLRHLRKGDNGSIAFFTIVKDFLNKEWLKRYTTEQRLDWIESFQSNIYGWKQLMNVVCASMSFVDVMVEKESMFENINGDTDGTNRVMIDLLTHIMLDQ